jgi:hypothetical protein
MMKINNGNMLQFERWFEEQVAPGEKRLLPGAVCLAATKDGKPSPSLSAT